MQNLAGNEGCDKYIERELTRAGIEVVRGERMNAEVPASITGKLGGFTFRRAWYYWVVNGNVPLTVAEELYDDPVGKEDVRVAGHCGCPPPGEFTTFIDDEGRILCPMSEKPEGDSEAIKSLLARADIRFVEDPSSDGEAFVTSYHVDTEVGLRLLADALKSHNLVNVS